MRINSDARCKWANCLTVPLFDKGNYSPFRGADELTCSKRVVTGDTGEVTGIIEG